MGFWLYISITALFIAAIAVANEAINIFLLFTSRRGVKKPVGKEWDRSKRLFSIEDYRERSKVEIPVFFLTRPAITPVPLRDKPFWYIDGTDDSCRNSGVNSRVETRAGIYFDDDKRAIIDDKKALPSWMLLLSALQQMERESSQWQKRQLEVGRPNSMVQNRTLFPALQRYAALPEGHFSVDNSICARTTLGDLCNITMILGMVWHEFDKVTHRYMCEGNGMSVTGTKVRGPNFLFTFFKSHQGSYQENRIIPSAEVRELCFGYVPTIFRTSNMFEEGIRSPADAEELEDILHTIQLDSPLGIVHTMSRIGCNLRTQSYFKVADSKVTHAFPGKTPYTLEIIQAAIWLI